MKSYADYETDLEIQKYFERNSFTQLGGPSSM